jgi:hypothetical protein
MTVGCTNLKGPGMTDPNQMKNTGRVLFPCLQKGFGCGAAKRCISAKYIYCNELARMFTLIVLPVPFGVDALSSVRDRFRII